MDEADRERLARQLDEPWDDPARTGARAARMLAELERGIDRGVALASRLMAIAITAPPAVKVAGNVEGADVTRSVKNTGANPVFLSRDPAVTSASASEFSIAAAATSPAITLAPGEELYAVCGAGLTSSVEVI